MDTNQKITFSQTRDFSGVFSATFDVIGQNWRILLKSFFVFVGPLVLIAGFLASFFQADMWSAVFAEFAGGAVAEPDFLNVSAMAGLIIAGVMSYISLFVTVILFYAFVLVYRERGPGQFDLPELWARFKRIFFPLAGLFLLIGLLYMVMAVVNIIPCLGQIVFILGFVYLIVPFTLAPMILLNEQRGYIDTLKRSIDLVKGYWWQTFGIIVIFGIVGMMFTYGLAMPGYMAIFASGWLTAGEGGLIFRILLIITSIVEQFGNAFYGLSTIAVAIHYFNLLERKEGLALMERIEGLSDQNENPLEYPET